MVLALGRAWVFLGAMKKAFDLRHPFFAPIWRRVLVVALTFGWAGVEYWNGSTGWALAFAGAGAWCVYQFFVVWELPED